jgi:hypothetical protein
MKNHTFTNMKKIKFLFLMLLTSVSTLAQVGINVSNPKATLDVVGKPNETSHIDGLIAPRITRAKLTSKNNLYGADQVGTIVYVTTLDGSGEDDTANVNSIGYYYHDGVKWLPLSGGNGGTGINQTNTNPVSIESGQIKNYFDPGAATYPTPVYNGFIKNVSYSRSSNDGTIITVTMEDQGTVDYNVFVTMQSNVTTGADANANNDFTVPVIFNKTPTSFQMFTVETASLIQSIQLSLLLVKYQTPGSTPSSFQKGRLTSEFDVAGSVITPTFNGFITGATFTTFSSSATIITINMADQGTTDYDVYTSIQSPGVSNTDANNYNDFLHPLIFNKTPTSFQIFVEERVSNVQQVQLSFLLANGIASPTPANIPKEIYKGTIETSIDVNADIYPTATYTGFIRQAAYEKFGNGTIITTYIPTQADTNYDVYTCLQSGVVAEADIRQSTGFAYPLIFNKTTTSFKTFIEETTGSVQQIKLGYLLVR